MSDTDIARDMDRRGFGNRQIADKLGRTIDAVRKKLRTLRPRDINRAWEIDFVSGESELEAAKRALAKDVALAKAEHSTAPLYKGGWPE
jgi:hypothetical protein